MRYRRKPVEVEASQVNPSSIEAIAKWCGGQAYSASQILHLDGIASPGDWVVMVEPGTFRIMTDHEFRATHEPVPDGE